MTNYFETTEYARDMLESAARRVRRMIARGLAKAPTPQFAAAIVDTARQAQRELYPWFDAPYWAAEEVRYAFVKGDLKGVLSILEYQRDRIVV